MIDFTAYISDFLAGKKLTLNSQKSYSYDLEQFCQQLSGKLDETSLRLYQESLTNLKPSAQKRKISSVNQFLFYLYEKRVVEHFYKLKSVETTRLELERMSLRDLENLYQETEEKEGQLIALLILELGLTPSEIADLQVSRIDKDFQVVTVKKAGTVRILTLSDKILHYLNWDDGQLYLFERAGKPYTRQWFFVRLTSFLRELGLTDLSAQTLREQYILREQAAGTTIFELAKKLGLKSTATLEKYYKHGH